MGERSMLEWALIYAEREWTVFPVVPGGKVPLIGGGHGCKEATTDVACIRRWWGGCPTANIGLHCGPQSNVWVFDVDADHGGLESLAALEAKHGALPPTLRSRTGGGGLHLFWTWPVDRRVKNCVGVKDADGVKLAGLDTRSWGGYVVLAPSLHKSGNRYAWEVRQAPVPAPEWMLDLVVGPVVDPASRPAPPTIPPALAGSARLVAYGHRSMENALTKIAECSEGMRHDVINMEAFKIGRLIGSGLLIRDEVEPILIQAGLATGKGQREVYRTVGDALTKGALNPRPLPEDRPRQPRQGPGPNTNTPSPDRRATR